MNQGRFFVMITFILFSLYSSLPLRRSKELTYNYVDRVRLAEHSLQQDYRCPTRGSGWRHNNKSISHLDLATSCHSTAFGPSHWPHNRQLRHSRSLDYAHLTERCKDPLDIAEFYWRLDPEGDALYEDEYEDEVPDEENELISRYNGEQSFRDYNYADSNYHTALANNNQRLHPSHLPNTCNSAANNNLVKTPTATATATLQGFDFGSESCSLRRSRSLAVIREETFSDLQITTANNSRRSQLIPRARIVNRGFIRERERLICGGGGNVGSASKHHHHHHHHGEELDYEGLSAVEQKVQRNNSINAGSRDVGELQQQQRAHTHLHRHHHHHHASGSVCGSGSGSGGGGNNNQDNLQYQNTQQQQPSVHPQSPTQAVQQPAQPQSREADDYYDNLKRLDALTLGLVEQLHPWHSEKSDLESLNSDYFKNSLHQSHELQQQLDFEALEEAVSFLASEKPRIYQSRRQQRVLSSAQQKLQNATDSYQENSQSSAFPETTTSNSDDQTDSPSLSEQEYDLKKIEKIYKKTAALEADEESYELISLTTTTRTRIDTTEDEEEEHGDSSFNCNEQLVDCPAAVAESAEKTNEHEPINGVLKRTRALSGNLEKLIAYDSVYLSSEESSESTLIDENHCGAYERTTEVTARLAEDTGETATLLHFSIEDIIYEPHNKQPLSDSERREFDTEQPAVAVACTATILTETDTAEIATQTAKEKQLVSIVETLNTKIEKIPLTANVLDEEKQGATRESTTLYTQILKVGHTSATCGVTNPSETTSTSSTTATTTAKALVTTGATATIAGIVKPATGGACLTSQPTVGITSSAASKPKILSVVEKRKWKRYNDTTATTNAVNLGVNNEVVVLPRGCGLESNASSALPPIDYPLTPLKKHQSTNVVDTLSYSPFATQPSDNQYHSLPDVSIGQSLKVSESIDAKLRSSYNVRKGELKECCRRAEVGNTSSNNNTTGKATHLLENPTNKCKLKQQREKVVTTEEIYDSIKRFGRAHQKARQKEYQEFHEVHVEKEKKREVKEKRLKVQDDETTKTEVSIDIHTTSTYPDSLAEEVDGEQIVSEDTAGAQEVVVLQSEVVQDDTSVDTNVADDTDSNTTARSSLDTSASEYQEQPKDAPDVEVENFSKLIERRAKEIKEKSAKPTPTEGEVKRTKNGGPVQSIETQHRELYTKQADDYHINAVASQFRIIVTDAQDNIIEEDAIENDDSLNSADQVDHAPSNNSAYLKLNLVTDVTTRRKGKKENSTKDKSTIVSTHTRVASLKRVPSKPKRQQHHIAQHHHCCQQQHNKVKSNNSNQNKAGAWCSQISSNTTNAPSNGNVNSSVSGSIDYCHDSNNYCELSIKSKEHRVLSTQIYKARPIKVLTANDSFRRRSTEGAVTAAGSKMSRPQILHVVDNKRRADILSTAKNVRNNNNSNSNFTKAKLAEEGSQVESEYLKKVDAVRNYWAKLTKEGNEQVTECMILDKQVGGIREGEAKEQRELSDCQTLKHANKQENVNELTKMKLEAEAQQLQQPQKPQPEPRHFILGPQAHGQIQSQSQSTYVQHQPAKPLKPSANQDEFCSFMPSIEIVELDGDKKATIVSTVPPDSEDASALANDANGEPQFDHIRYKVLKSQQLLRSNIVPRSKKEAQFDGLIQYLQEYSFQELLANNNVVIVEPVRTKIERPLAIAQSAANVAATKKLTRKSNEGNDSKVEQKPKEPLANDGLSNACIPKPKEKISKEVGETGERAAAVGGIKRHFFYQPVRVNRELYEEELPNPDVVRNVRRFFEENVLPTPRGGMQLLHRPPPDVDTFVERSAATQLPSPRARRTRKYRYLTIDTSYGHLPPQHQSHQLQQQQQSKQQPETPIANKNGSPFARKWDTTSLSSGISSGDLSSPCEYNEMDAACTEKPEAVNEEVLKGVHVQAVVQRHNNRNMRHTATEHIDANVSGVDDCNGLLQLRPRPRPRSCAVRNNEDATYRISDIYEQHASQQQQRNFTRDDKNSRLTTETATDDEDADDEDLDDEVYESHYVSKDVLEKIRECGSTITYYGGRVLQSTSPDPMPTGNHNNNYNNNSQANTANTNIMTLTKRRVRQIESCNVCEPPRDFADPQATTQKFPQQCDKGHDKNNSATKGPVTNDGSRESSLAHFGIKFKLVKSNSCSSRLELAGTGVEVVETGADEAEVVKKMVHRFECGKTRREAEHGEEPLTINNQMPARRLLGCAQTTTDMDVGDVKQVTVNNHINVPMTTYTLEAPSVKRDHIDYTHVDDNKLEMENAYKEKTYQTFAMDIHLSHIDQRKTQALAAGDSVDVGDGTLKVWRNKNVDLAFTMAQKQQQQHMLSAGESTITLNRNATQREPPQFAKQTASSTTPANTPLISHNDDAFKGIREEDEKFQNKINLRNDEFKQQQTWNGNDSTSNETLRTLRTQVEPQRTLHATTTPILAPRSSQRPAQIVVPVEIHRVDPQTPEPHGRASVASSRGSSVTTVITTNTTALLDKSVVRHYVANDKSLFEKRKYDDIEFEEFEVYDPTKDFEKLIEKEKRREEAKRDEQSQPSQHHEQQEEQQPVYTNLSRTSLNGANDAAMRYDEDEDEEDDGRKSKLGSECYDYDSLEDKL